MADVTKKTEIEADAEALVSRRRVSPLQFFQEVRREMSKVTWPSWKETWLTTMMVFIMVGLTMVFFAVVDFVLQYGEYLLIGARRLY
jgi:preprotein translocase subunit SecE